MPTDEFGIYFAAMRQIESQETMGLLKVQDWSRMKDDSRESRWQALRRQAYPVSTKPSATSVSNEDLDKWLRSTLGG